MRSRGAFIRRTFDQAWSQGRTAIVEEGIGDVVFHYGGEYRRTDGHGLRSVIDAWRQGFPDLTFSIEDLVEAEDRIAVRARLRGTHPWALAGHPGHWASVARHGEGTTWGRLLPRGWDHRVASDGTSWGVSGRLNSRLHVRRIDGERGGYREVTVIEIKEVLRLWLRDEMGLRPIAETAGVDRKTVRRYVDAAVVAGLDRAGGEGQLTDELIGAVVEAVRPARPAGRGAAWEACRAEHDRIKTWLATSWSR